MENQLMRSKFMYYFIIIFTSLILIGNFILLVISLNLTKPVYTKTVDYGSGVTETFVYNSPIYPILKTNQVVLIILVILINMALFGYFLFCFVTNKVKVSKMLGVILYGIDVVLLLINFKVIMAALSLLVVGYLLNVKTDIATDKVDKRKSKTK